MEWKDMTPGAVVRYEFGLLRVDQIDSQSISYSTDKGVDGQWVDCGAMRRAHVERVFLRPRLWNLAFEPPTPEQTLFTERRREEVERRKADGHTGAA